MGLLGWVVSAVGVLGVGGFIALLVVAPAIATQIAAGVGRFLSWMLSTRIGVGLLVGAACLLAGELHGDHIGASRVQSKWDEAREAAAAEKQKRETEIAEKAREQERTIIADEKAADQQSIKELNEQLSKIKGECPLDDDFIEWLRKR